MTDTPLTRAARALAYHEGGQDCYDGLDEAMQQSLLESVRVVQEAVRGGKSISERAQELANQIVPEYQGKRHDFDGHYAKRWDAAYEAAFLALGGEPSVT